jgi:hypothetical protein
MNGEEYTKYKSMIGEIELKGHYFPYVFKTTILELLKDEKELKQK